MTHRSRLLERGIRLEQITIGWNVVEAAVAIGAGWMAGSVALVGFGLDSVIETISAGALYHRLRGEQRGSSREEAERRERRALRIVGVTFFLLAAYVTLEAIRTLVRREPPAESPVGIALAALSLVVMPLLALQKQRVGKALGSRAGATPATMKTSPKKKWLRQMKLPRKNPPPAWKKQNQKTGKKKPPLLLTAILMT